MPHAPDLSGCALDDRYELHAVLGEGAFGRVYRGWDRRLERPVAIKLIKPWWAEDPEWAQSFEREAQLLARVSDPGIVQIFDVGHAPEGLYYVSELVEGESLANRLRRGPLTPWDGAAVAEQLCRALAQAHAQRVIHRDVKPANILISVDGAVKVGDFGVARLAEGSTEGATATVVGTPRYMAPEQARGRRTTPATDVYSVGIVLYEMLAGRPPFTERSAVELALRHLGERPGPLPGRIPEPLAAIVERALAKDPLERYPDAGEMADALAVSLQGAPVRTPSAVGRDRAPRRRRSHALAGPRALVPAAPRALVAAPAPASSGAPPRRPRQIPLPPGHEPPAQASGPAGPAAPPPTRRAPRLNPRRNLNPAARRRSIAALSLAFLLLGAMIIAALLIGATAQVRVPQLLRLTRSQVTARTKRLALEPSFTSRYAQAPQGTVIGQLPAAGKRVREGSAVGVILSAGPPPVKVPQLAGESAGQARSALQRLGLRARIAQIAAPGVPAGTVTSQSPAPGAELTPSRSVALNVAETPHWRGLTLLTGSGQATATEFRVRGTRWRIVYTMSYQGTCTFIFFCSGPTAEVDNVAAGSSVSGFGLSEGGGQTRVFATGRGDYRLQVSPGSDTARWSMRVQDYY